MDADVVIIGGGSAGNVLAARLTEDPSCRVVLLEAGEEARHPWLRIPVGYARTVGDPKFDWCFTTEPQAELHGRQLRMPRGKVLGGSSALNGMLYVRGQREDYDDWAALGNRGWSWNDVLPYFLRSEDYHGAQGTCHAHGGPLAVEKIGPDPLTDAFLQACGQAGHALVDDVNCGSNAGAGYFDMTTRRGVRASTEAAYLRPARRRPNLSVLTGALVERIEFTGARADAVRFWRGDTVQTVRASAQVVVAAGAFHSPQVLMLSGIGDPDRLQALGIPVRVPAREVGRNLQDHLQVRLVQRCRYPWSINDIVRSRWRQAVEGLRYLATRRGLLAWAVYRGFVFAASTLSPGRPDLQIHFGLASFPRLGEPVDPFSGFTISVCQLRPTSRGEVTLRSADFRELPRVQPRFLSTEADRRVMTEAALLGRALAQQPALADVIAEEVAPGPACADTQSLLEYVRATAFGVHHPVGTCRMGSDEDAVVTPELRVRGAAGLRVVDASVMPLIVSGNTNAPTIMIAERAADLIRADLRAR